MTTKSIEILRQGCRGVLIGALMTGVVSTAIAGERMELSGLTFLDPAPGGAGAKAVITILDGFVVNQRGALFLGKARMHTVFPAAGITHSGVKVLTLPDGDQLFVHYQAMDAEPPEMSGRWAILSGSGRYEGVSGSGTYIATEVWNGGAIWDVFEGVYELNDTYQDQFGQVVPEPPVE